MSEIGVEDTINWHEPIATESGMDAFVIVMPVSLEPDLHVVHLDTDDHIQLLQAVPVYASELPLFRELGASEFMSRLDQMALNPLRPVLGA